MCISIEAGSPAERLVIQVSAAFCVEDAQQIDSLLAHEDPEADVDIDFREVRECEAPALAHLVEVIRARHARVALRGASRHIWKLLEYLDAGLDPRDGRPHGRS